MPSSSSSPTQRRKRPLLLVVVLFVTWTLGLGGLMSGCGTLEFYRSNTHDTSIATNARMSQQMQEYVQAQQKARVHAMTLHQRRMVPLGAANMLLSALLVLACARALSLRPNAHWLAQQAVFANLAFAIVDYLVSAPVREAIIKAGVDHPLTTEGLSSEQLATTFRWAFRTGMLLQVAALSVAAWLLTRPQIVALYRPSSPPPNES